MPDSPKQNAHNFIIIQQMSGYQQRATFEDSYQLLFQQYNTDEEIVHKLEKQLQNVNSMNTTLSNSIEKRQKEFQLTLDEVISKQSEANGKQQNQNIIRELERVSEVLLDLDIRKKIYSERQKNYSLEIKELERSLLGIKKQAGQNADVQTTKQGLEELQGKIKGVQSSIKETQEKIMEKNNSISEKMDQIHEQAEDFNKLSSKLQEEVALKEEEETLQKQKLVIEHGKLTKLKNEHSEKHQTYLSLVKHYEQIKQRVTGLKKQKRMLTKEKEKQKNMPTKYPVRQQISIYEKQNHLLEEQLGKEQQKLREYQQIMKNSINQEIMTDKKKLLEELKIQEIKMKESTKENQRLNEQYTSLNRNLEFLVGTQQEAITEKKNKMRVCKEKVKQYQHEKVRLENLIEKQHNKLANVKIQGGHKKSHKAAQRNHHSLDKNSTNQKQNSTNKSQEGGKGFFGGLKEEVMGSFNDWNTKEMRPLFIMSFIGISMLLICKLGGVI